MVKIRLQGTSNDVKRMKRVIERCRNISVSSVSDVYPNKGTKKYYRQYLDVIFETKNKDI